VDGIIPANWGDAFAGGFGFATAFLVVKLAWEAIKWVATFKTARADKNEERLDAGTAQLFDRMNEEIDRLSGECAALRERATTAEEHHAECRREVMELRGLIQGRGDARNDSARIVARDRVADKRKMGEKE
jgi:hypothetical protein